MPEAASQSSADPPDRPLSPALDTTFKSSLVP